MKQCILILVFSWSSIVSLNAQTTYAREIVSALSSTEFWGRGYTNNGMGKAAIFIEKQMHEIGLQPVGNSFLQPFVFPANTFPGKMSVKIGNRALKEGKDFIVSPFSQGLKGDFKLTEVKSGFWQSADGRLQLERAPKLTWSASSTVENVTQLILHDSVPIMEGKIKVNIQQKLVSRFEANNVIGKVVGTQFPDSFLVLTAHYDHLGGMGSNVYFPGANDNASGTALLLSMAQYYQANPAPYTIVFIAFAAEEIGLKGSKHFVENPLFPLANIKFLVNLDLMGNGDEGITVVNASEFAIQFQALLDLNKTKNWFSAINPRGKAANSDHYHFSEKGVPAFFIYTLGGTKAYHDVYDIPESIKMNHFDGLLEMLVAFFGGL